MPTAPIDRIDLLFRAFSDRTRLRILNLLKAGDEICVCDLMRVLDLPQAKVSRHLAYLRRAGLVAGRKHRQWLHYRLLPAKGKSHAKLLECLRCCLGDVPALKSDIARLGEYCTVNGNCC
jgi:ArsR family transcriptional regulator